MLGVVSVVVFAVAEEGEVAVEPGEQGGGGFGFRGQFRTRCMCAQFGGDVFGLRGHRLGVTGCCAHIVEDSAQALFECVEVAFGDAVDLETDPGLLLRGSVCAVGRGFGDRRNARRVRAECGGFCRGEDLLALAGSGDGDDRVVDAADRSSVRGEVADDRGHEMGHVGEHDGDDRVVVAEFRRVDARIIDGDRRFLTVVFGAECEVTGRRGCVGLRVVSPCFEPRIIGFEEVLGSRLSPLLPPLFCNVRN